MAGDCIPVWTSRHTYKLIFGRGHPYLVIKCPQQTCSMVLDNWMLLFLGLNDKESDTDLGDKNRPMIMYFSVHLGLVSFHMCIKERGQMFNTATSQ